MLWQDGGMEGTQRARVDPKYKAMSKALRTPGMQKGEKELIAKVAAHRGVSTKEAKAIAVRRTAKGRDVGGPGGMKRGIVTNSDGTTQNVTLRKPGTKAPKRKKKSE